MATNRSRLQGISGYTRCKFHARLALVIGILTVWPLQYNDTRPLKQIRIGFLPRLSVPFYWVFLWSGTCWGVSCHCRTHIRHPFLLYLPLLEAWFGLGFGLRAFPGSSLIASSREGSKTTFFFPSSYRLNSMKVMHPVIINGQDTTTVEKKYQTKYESSSKLIHLSSRQMNELTIRFRDKQCIVDMILLKHYIAAK